MCVCGIEASHASLRERESSDMPLTSILYSAISSFAGTRLRISATGSVGSSSFSTCGAWVPEVR